MIFCVRLILCRSRGRPVFQVSWPTLFKKLYLRIHLNYIFPIINKQTMLRKVFYNFSDVILSLTSFNHLRISQFIVSWLINCFLNAYLMSTVNHISFLLYVPDAFCFSCDCVIFVFVTATNSKYIKFNIQ